MPQGVPRHIMAAHRSEQVVGSPSSQVAPSFGTNPQLPAVQDRLRQGEPELAHTVPQPPQFKTSSLTLCSQPLPTAPRSASQSSKFSSQAYRQAPPSHAAEALGGLPHASPQAPQCPSSVARSTQLPSHSTVPPVHSETQLAVPPLA